MSSFSKSIGFPISRLDWRLIQGAAFVLFMACALAVPALRRWPWLWLELVFRGVLFDAVQSQWGKWGTLTGTAVLFGLGHLHGYPPGAFGACLAAVFGFMVGVLRLWTGGLLLPIVAHMGADATIYIILVHSGGV